jgi:blue copper oxidase
MYHCHMLTHEDDGMMGQFIVYDSNSSQVKEQSLEFSIYPNPASEEIVLKSQQKIERYTIYDLSGKEVKGEHSVTDYKIEIYELPVGPYIIEIEVDGSFKMRNLFFKF